MSGRAIKPANEAGGARPRHTRHVQRVHGRLLPTGRLLSGLAVVLAFAAAACRNAGAQLTAGDSGAVAADSSAETSPCFTYYVSPTGMDSNPGCSRFEPKRTIAAAIQAAMSGGESSPRISVCAGTYAESGLVLNFPGGGIGQGASDCEDWDAASGGAVIKGGPVSPATLIVGGGFTVGGLVIYGSSAPSTEKATESPPYAAVAVIGPGSPVIQDNELFGGDGAAPANSVATAALYIAGGASPTITGNHINGGSGTGQSGSAGIVSDGSGDLMIGYNTVNGGSGSGLSGFGSAALRLVGPASGSPTATFTLEGNTLYGGTGSAAPGCSGASCRASVGVQVSGAANLVFSGNTVDGGCRTATRGELSAMTGLPTCLSCASQPSARREAFSTISEGG
jgi:hypothetical protein